MENVNQNLFYDSVVDSSPPSSLPSPAISVVIPLYNAEEYVGECLESILNQTFQNFEVIVVDDCSTDSSREIAESYIPKFDGRLRVTKTEVNSGGGGYVPRNVGFSLASGEYVIFVDADDFVLLTALETLYNAAKQYDAEVVYSASHYQLRKNNDVRLLKDGKGKKFQEDGLEDETILIVDNPAESLQTLIFERGFTTPWTQFVRREFLLQNNITFPEIPKAGDYIWVINIYCHAKRFLRFTTPVYFYRIYNANSVSQRKAQINDLSNWVASFAIFVESIMALAKENEFLTNNPSYCYEASKRYFEWCLNRTNEARKKLSNQEICDLLYREFDNRNDFSNAAIPFFFSVIETSKRELAESTKTINEQNKELEQLNKASIFPAVSVIIPLYNAEKYVGECLDSLLEQTFKNFELIMVDDCSTDSSCEIVESYIPKFNGRLKLYHMEENTGSGALPRNKGLALSSGKYVFNMDNDDMLTKTALEELYTLAEEHDVDIVYCEKFYEVNPDGSGIRENVIQKGKLVKEPTLESEDLAERVQAIIDDRYYVVPWSKLIRRSLLVEHDILFPALEISDDNIWHQELMFCAKKFLRVPNVIYIYRLTETSLLRRRRDPKCHISFWLNPVLLGLKKLDKVINKNAFFKANPSCRYALLKNFVDKRFTWTLKSARNLTEDEIYSTIEENFGDKLGNDDVLVSLLCTALYNEKKNHSNYDRMIRKFTSYISARLDVKFIPETDGGDFQIVSLSDSKAKVDKPKNFQGDGVGYVIQSYCGGLEIVFKATTNGKINCSLRGISVFDKLDKTKRVPYWVDFTLFAVNGKTIFGKPTPVWHDRPCHYNINTIKAGEEITLKAEWLPHRLDSSASYAQIIQEFTSCFTARIDAKFVPKTAVADSDFQIISVSDDKAKVEKPDWLQKDGIGYLIKSYVGKLEVVFQATTDGEILFKLRGLYVYDKPNKSKLIPYWIDYTALIINDTKVLNELTPTSHNKPYTHKIDVKTGEEINVKLEWFPHRGDI